MQERDPYARPLGLGEVVDGAVARALAAAVLDVYLSVKARGEL